MEIVEINLYCIKNLVFKEKLFISFFTNSKVIWGAKVQTLHQQNTSGTVDSDVVLNCFSLSCNRDNHVLHFCPRFWNPSSFPAMSLEKKNMSLLHVHYIEWRGEKYKIIFHLQFLSIFKMEVSHYFCPHCCCYCSSSQSWMGPDLQTRIYWEGGSIWDTSHRAEQSNL